MTSVVIGAGSNLGDRRHHLREAVLLLRRFVSVVRVSPVFETEPVGAPSGSADFLNLVLVGHTRLSAASLLTSLHAVERSMGRRRGERNAARAIDLDLILHGATIIRSEQMTVPHPRYSSREFVLAPLRTLVLPWIDPPTGRPLAGLRGSGHVRPAGAVYRLE